MEQMTPDQAVDAIFADLRDRRFLKWMFDKYQPGAAVCTMLVGGVKETLYGIDAEMQAEIRATWLAVIERVAGTPMELNRQGAKTPRSL